MELIDQQVINDNKEIYATIQHELLKAESQIILATGWFTDEDLFNILSDKLEQHVSIEIIIADNQDNEKLDFEQLVAKGASVYKIKSNGYGTMNQKFCVIDKRIALHGSYNWSVNAKKNNHESIISTNHRETINSLIENFNTIKQGIIEQKSTPAINYTITVTDPEVPEEGPLNQPLKAETEFQKVLDSMIAAEIGNFDRKMLREQGFLRCSANNGDHQVLHKAFDTLYSVFINDIDVIDDKKKRLITKIEEYRIKSQDALGKQCEIQVNGLERESAVAKNNLEIKTIHLSAEIESATKSIKEISENKMPPVEKENSELDKQIKETEHASVKPIFKWYEFIPAIIFNLALLCYLLIFYSSAAYILLFSVEDAKIQEAQNIPVAPAQIFNPEALTQVLDKTGTASFFIFLFVFIPLAFAIVDHFVSPKWKFTVAVLSFIFGIVVLDGTIAYKVTEAVYASNYAQGNVDVPWKANMVFTDTNFYLVFVFGASGLLLFKLTFKKLMNVFEERSPDIIARRNQLKAKHLREEMSVNSNKLLILREHTSSLEINVTKLRAEIKQTDIELRDLPIRLNQELQLKRTQLLKDSENIDRIAAIYTMHIQSDKLPVTIDALKDRMNIFLEGWNDFLHKEYAVAKATLKTTQAAEVAAKWQNEKLSSNKIDNRIKIFQDV